MGHRGFVIDEYEPSKYRLWYTHWGALLRYETPDEQKVPLPFGPDQYPQRDKDDHIFLRSMWPTTYTTKSTYQTVYNKEGEDTGVIQEWDSLSKLGVIFDYWEEMHWQIYDEVCPLCKNPNDLFTRLIAFIAHHNATTRPNEQIDFDGDTIGLSFAGGRYYLIWYGENDINRFERPMALIDNKLLATNRKKYDYMRWMTLPHEEAYDCPECRGSGRKYDILGATVFIGENDMFPMMIGGKPDSYGTQPRVSRWDIVKHGYWGLAWRGKNRQEIDQFGTMDEDKREDLSKIAQREFSRQLEVERQKLPTDINEKQLRTICNKAFNEAAFIYYMRFMDTSDGPLATIPSWSVYGADVSYQYLALNYSLDRFQMPSPGPAFRIPYNPLPKKTLEERKSNAS